MAILLGIDTGGTYTDAVLYDDSPTAPHNGILRSAKALTTKYDLAEGIRNAISAVLQDAEREVREPGASGAAEYRDIRLVSLSTTLATNAIVEGHGTPIGLLLLGYPSDALDLAGLRQAVGSDPVAFINGGHTVSGDEQMPLDIEAARQAIALHAPNVTAFAVSGYFAVRNPAHELAVCELVREIAHLPVTCGHELTSNLDAPRRALTTVINARLIPLLQQLILAVRGILAEKGIRAELMVVQGDGSLMDAEMALRQPVQTILSGPAASVVGARHLSGEDNVMVVDMGGTTSDVALLQDGRPVLNKEGATVGGWRTMVEAVAVHTFGLGGDSEVRLNDSGEIIVGPRRMTPLSLLAHQHPHALDMLRQQLDAIRGQGSEGKGQRVGRGDQDAGTFALRQRPIESGASLSSEQRLIWEMLANGPMALAEIINEPRMAYFRRMALTQLIDRGAVVMAGFTPSDAAHVLGNQSDWNTEAAYIGAALWAHRWNTLMHTGQETSSADEDAQSICRRVVRQVVVQSGRALVTAALAEAHGVILDERHPAQRLLIDRPLDGLAYPEGVLSVSLTLQRPIVAIGAPVATYYPTVAERLHTRLCIPPHAGMANAVGAVAGGVMQTVHAQIKLLEDGSGFRVHLPTGIHDFVSLDDAGAFAVEQAGKLVEALAHTAGASDPQVQSQRHDHIARVRREDGTYDDMYIDSTVTATAIGRPRLAERVEISD